VKKKKEEEKKKTFLTLILKKKHKRITRSKFRLSKLLRELNAVMIYRFPHTPNELKFISLQVGVHFEITERHRYPVQKDLKKFQEYSKPASTIETSYFVVTQQRPRLPI